jgi:hypothetical protein
LMPAIVGALYMILLVRKQAHNSDVEADVALSRCAPSGPRSLTPGVGRTRTGELSHLVVAEPVEIAGGGRMLREVG